MGISGQAVVRRSGRPGGAALSAVARPVAAHVPLGGTTAAGRFADNARSVEVLGGQDTAGRGAAGEGAVVGTGEYAAARDSAADSVLDMLLHDVATAMDPLVSCAVAEARVLGFTEAAGFAGMVEELSRSLEFIQIIAAQAVERTRDQAFTAQKVQRGSSAAAREWRTGWTEPASGGEANSAAASDAVATGASVAAVRARPESPAGLLDDGYKNAAEFLRARLRIGIGEAKRRLALAAEVLPQMGLTGQEIPPRREILAQAVGSALVPSRSATIISTALDKVRHLTDDDTLTRMEHALTTTAVETDPDFVTKMAKAWTDRIDADGPEPTEEVLRQIQGAFLRRRRRHGLHHLEVFATDEQIETLTTAMNVATNPRLTTQGPGDLTHADTDTGSNTVATLTGSGAPEAAQGSASPDLDRRSRAQKLLDGLVGACSVAMTTGKLPSNGGLRPQLTVTIDHRDLFNQLTHTQQPSTGTATFTGPIHPNTIRKIACDADIIPVLLGTDSRVLDIGRTTRIFPPHLRKAITARDGGCAFPDCTMPAPWCEAHHITYWTHGGTTSTENGTLLCSHHHHLIHKENWTIDMKTGIPWFIPPPHIDPTQKPRKNHHHTPHRT